MGVFLHPSAAAHNSCLVCSPNMASVTPDQCPVSSYDQWCWTSVPHGGLDLPVHSSCLAVAGLCPPLFNPYLSRASPAMNESESPDLGVPSELVCSGSMSSMLCPYAEIHPQCSVITIRWALLSHMMFAW